VLQIGSPGVRDLHIVFVSGMMSTQIRDQASISLLYLSMPLKDVLNIPFCSLSMCKPWVYVVFTVNLAKLFYFILFFLYFTS
jgi:hypothetical protein